MVLSWSSGTLEHVETLLDSPRCTRSGALSSSCLSIASGLRRLMHWWIPLVPTLIQVLSLTGMTLMHGCIPLISALIHVLSLPGMTLMSIYVAAKVTSEDALARLIKMDTIHPKVPLSNVGVVDKSPSSLVSRRL